MSGEFFNTDRFLNGVPATGWESKKCNADKQREASYKGRSWTDQTKGVKAQRSRTKSNVGKVLGAFPLVTGQIVGLSRIILTIKDDRALYGDKHPLLNKAKHITRGATEFIGLGALWFISDIIVTEGRHNARARKEYNMYNS